MKIPLKSLRHGRNLSVGDRLVIPEFRPAANALPNPAHPLSWTSGAVWETIPKQSPGSRMILFLRSKATEGPTSNGAQAGGRCGWLPSDMMNWMMASVMWLHGNQLYYLIRESNAGPSILYASKYSPEAVRNRVSEIVKNQRRDMAVVLTTPNSGQRAEALKRFVRSEFFPVQQFALEQLGQSGPSAAPTILAMLNDPAFANSASQLIEALVKAGGKGVGGNLNDLLVKQLAFWKSTAPSLRQGWWNADFSIHAPLREEYGKTQQLVVGIGQIRYLPALPIVTQLRDYWRSQPQLNDPSGLDQMVEECNKSIRHLQTN